LVTISLLNRNKYRNIGNRSIKVKNSTLQKNVYNTYTGGIFLTISNREREI